VNLIEKYNLKLKQYPFGQQVRIYKNPISSGRDIEKTKVDNGNETLDPQRSLEVSVSRAKQKILDLLLCNDWQWFVTLTFNPEKVDSLNYEKCSKALSTYLDNTKRRKTPNLKYVGVPEVHKSGRYHYHFLMSNTDGLEFIPTEHKDINGRTIYHIGNYKLGWVTATEISNSQKASSYVMKYITKDLITSTKNKKMYWRTKNLIEPEICTHYLPDDSKEIYKELTKEKTTSAKVVDVKSGSFKNTIEILWNTIT